MKFAFSLARPVLSAIQPELAHRLTLKALRAYGRSQSRISIEDQEVQVAGLSWPNRVGLAAGFDKNAIAVAGLAKLGFGFLEIGGVTPVAQKGNKKPRVFRVNSQHAVINRMGFNNDGLEQIVARLRALKSIAPIKIGVNIGKNTETENKDAIEDYKLCLQGLAPVADFVTFNISSPNTPGLADLQEYKTLEKLLAGLQGIKQETELNSGKRIACFVKISPDLSKRQLESTSKVIVESGCDGIIATNTTTSRPDVHNQLLRESGGLSGKPLFDKACETIDWIRRFVHHDFPIIGVGGIFSSEDAIEMIRVGANLIQVYTGLVYRGPKLISELVNALGRDNLQEQVGTAVN